MPHNLVLIITCQADTHINKVGKYLTTRNVEWIRLNTEDLFTNTTMSLSPRDGSGHIVIKDSGKSFDIDDVSAIWYRKPETPSVAHLTIEEDHERRFFEAESYENLLSLYTILQDRPWINNPFTTKLAFRRFHQLQIAHRLGMRTVRSIFSNEQEEIFGFADMVKGRLALKSLSALSVFNATGDDTVNQYGMLTRTIGYDDLHSIRSSIPALPTFIQEYIEKSYDLRIVVVGDQVFPCRIHSQADSLTQQDFRIGTRSLKHEIIDIPSHLTSLILRFMKELDIDFGCFDFVEVEDGDPYFLECNPNGQWLWIEEATAAPIAKAIANRLYHLAGGS